VGSEFIHADEQTDMTKLIVALRDFEKRVKKERKSYPTYCGGEHFDLPEKINFTVIQ
jgi:hypothetical protein